MSKYLLGAAAAAFLMVGASGGAMAQDCDIKSNQYTNGWTCVQEASVISSTEGWIKSGNSDNCRWGPVDLVQQQWVAINPGGDPVDSKNGSTVGDPTYVAENPGGPAVTCVGKDVIANTNG